MLLVTRLFCSSLVTAGVPVSEQTCCDSRVRLIWILACCSALTAAASRQAVKAAMAVRWFMRCRAAPTTLRWRAASAANSIQAWKALKRVAVLHLCRSPGAA